MTFKLDPFKEAPALMSSWMDASTRISASLEPALIDLVKVRASQINGCANCVNMHTEEARRRGESEQRLYLLSAWREAPCYNDRERAALAWTESMTMLAAGLPDAAVHQVVDKHFSHEEQVKLTLMINIINGWNRIAVGFGLWYESGKLVTAAGQ